MEAQVVYLDDHDGKGYSGGKRTRAYEDKMEREREYDLEASSVSQRAATVLQNMSRVLVSETEPGSQSLYPTRIRVAAARQLDSLAHSIAAVQTDEMKRRNSEINAKVAQIQDKMEISGVEESPAILLGFPLLVAYILVVSPQGLTTLAGVAAMALLGSSLALENSEDRKKRRKQRRYEHDFGENEIAFAEPLSPESMNFATGRAERTAVNRRPEFARKKSSRRGL